MTVAQDNKTRNREKQTVWQHKPSYRERAEGARAGARRRQKGVEGGGKEIRTVPDLVRSAVVDVEDIP